MAMLANCQSINPQTIQEKTKAGKYKAVDMTGSYKYQAEISFRALFGGSHYKSSVTTFLQKPAHKYMCLTVTTNLDVKKLTYEPMAFFFPLLTQKVLFLLWPWTVL